MVSDRMMVVLAALDRDDARGADAGPPAAVATAAAVALDVDGITAVVGTGSTGVVVAWGTEAVSVTLEDLQFTLGEGPGLEAATTGVPVLVPDLAAAAARWPVFAPAASTSGAGAIFVFPLWIGAISVGAMTLDRSTVGPLSAGQVTDALALADAVTGLMLDHQSTATGGDRPGAGWAQPVTYRAEVHQATGMISVQLGVGLAEAVARLRAHAWSGDRLLADVAADVVARRLRFDGPNL